MAQFSWLPFFEEMLTNICKGYDKKTLCTLFREIFADASGVMDKFADGSRRPLEEVDPLTFIGYFNRQTADRTRIRCCELAKEKMGLESSVPSDFDGIPRLNNMNAWFFPYAKERGVGDIDALWIFARALSESRPHDDSFRDVLRIKFVAIPKATVLMFVCKPAEYLSLDNTNTNFLQSRGIPNARPLCNEMLESEGPLSLYQKFLGELRGHFGSKPFWEISHEASQLKDSSPSWEITPEQFSMLKQRFDSRVSGFVDFESPGGVFCEEEMNYKREALEKYQGEVGNERVREWLEAGEGQKALKEISKRVQLNLVQFMSWQQSIGATDEQATAILKAFMSVAGEEYADADTVRPIFEETAKQGLKPAWDTFSVILWAIRPETYAPIKIKHFRSLADELNAPLPKGRITPEKFDAVYNWMKCFWDVLESEGYKPSDWVDVHSFIWCVCPDSYSPPVSIRYWLIAPGEKAKFWEEFKESGIISLGWNETGDLSQYSDKKTILRKLVELFGEPSRTNDALALWQFYNEMNIGDEVFAKKGDSEIIGYGRIVSQYTYDSNEKTYHHVRKVKWLSTGNWKIPSETGSALPRKVLTDMTNKKTFLDRWLPLVKVSSSAIPATEKGYWWLNANPKVWDFTEMAVGETQTYTSHNESGDKRRIYKYFEEVKPGDVVLGYVASPDREIVALCEITQGLHESERGEVIEFKNTAILNTAVSLEELRAIPELKECLPLVNNQGSLFAITPTEYEIISGVIDEKNPAPKPVQPYTAEDAMMDVFLDRSKFDDIIDAFKFKKNIILQGPPGVGKTFIAKRLAYTLMGQKDDDRVQMIQFHQSYSYEDFIQGYRPTDNGNFEIKNGVFYEFCKKAQRDKERKYVFIIDEINRGNLSKIFGELMMLVEPDKRGAEYAMPLTYAQDRDEKFYIPQNLHLIGTMNTADRSLAMVDYALRRRFSFIDLEPCFASNRFRDFLGNHDVEGSIIDAIIERMGYLNEQIAKDDKNLGIGYRIGHSFFCPDGTGRSYDWSWYELVVTHEIAPLVQEYWFDDESKARSEIERLREVPS